MSSQRADQSKPLADCCQRALYAWTLQANCPECGRSLAGLSTWADELNAETRRRPTRDDREAYDADDAYYGDAS